MPGPNDEFIEIMNRAADHFERWQPAPYPDPQDHPANLARDGASALTQLLSLHMTGRLGANLTDYESAMLTAAMEVLDDLREKWGPVGEEWA